MTKKRVRVANPLPFDAEFVSKGVITPTGAMRAHTFRALQQLQTSRRAQAELDERERRNKWM